MGTAQDGQIRHRLHPDHIRRPGFRYAQCMDTVKLGKKGQLSVPKKILDELGLRGDDVLLVESTPDGAILLRPAGVYPIEIYSEARTQEFLAEDAMTDDLRASLQKRLSVQTPE